ncbi:PolyA pol domain containing protein [Asbolus verrucosus]|uniref:PolyA pol domain containing protein n=1 Tax=Asbolus verrucosus TaxID=1661398 RepID=A0A482V9I0_ASBVE|nr:PolyA pol domain containing protein [Asbolus verrucosus]
MFLLRHRVLNQLSHTLKQRYCKLVHLSKAERVEFLRRMALPKARENPVIFKLDTPDFRSLFTDELKSLASLFKEYGYEIRIAGGAVRDLLSGVRPTDLDFATTATPEEMKEMFKAESVRMINMNGEKHGTITPRINDKENFEVTTLRIDVVTDGRHAEVQFTTDWMLDALRRDLTINSMFLGLDGSVYDFFYGYDDLKERKVKFVGDPVTRIQEDYLRILRYFRFYGKISKEPDKHEADTIKAIVENKEGLKNVSGERIWMELKKTLEGNFAGDLLMKILECGLGPLIGLPENSNLDELKLVWGRSKGLKLHPITLISSLLNNQEDAVVLNSRLKLSVFERDLALFIVENRTPKLHVKPLMPYQQIVLKINNKYAFQYVVEVLKYLNSPDLVEFQNWKIPKFPVTGNMLKDMGVESGRKMGLVLAELRNFWADHEYKVTAEELLKQVPDVLHLLSEKKKNK